MRKRAGSGPPVRQHAQDGEELRPPLDLVDHHDAPQRPSAVIGSVEAREAGRVLQVEVSRRIGRTSHGPCRLAALARADEDDDGAPP